MDKFIKKHFNLEGLVGLNKTELKELVKKHNIKPHSLDDVVNALLKQIPRPPKVKKEVKKDDEVK